MSQSHFKSGVIQGASNIIHVNRIYSFQAVFHKQNPMCPEGKKKKYDARNLRHNIREKSLIPLMMELTTMLNIPHADSLRHTEKMLGRR